MITEKRQQKIEQIVKNRQSGLIVVLENIHDPHNAAAILRSCDAFGIKDVYFVFETVEPYNPKKVGKVSSSSANKWLDFQTFRTSKDCFDQLKKDGYEIVVTILDEQAQSINEIDLINDKLALVISNEHAGVSEYAAKNATKKMYVPMQGMVQSFNVSVTAGICLYELNRQRLQSGNDYSLTKKEQAKLIKDYCER